MNLYAWTTSTTGISPSSATTIYTDTPNPSYDGIVGDIPTFYNADGTVLSLNTITVSGNMFFDVYSASDSEIKIRFD